MTPDDRESRASGAPTGPELAFLQAGGFAMRDRIELLSFLGVVFLVGFVVGGAVYVLTRF